MDPAPWCERLSPVDAMFLQLEDASAHMHMGGVFECEGPPPPQAELLAHLAARLERVPRYRQRLSTVPLGLGRPAWVDDPAFDLAQHVRRITLAAPGREALEAQAARCFGERLDRRRPLWGMDFVDGLGGDRFALVSRTHHSLVDGMGGCDIVTAITDDAAEGPTIPAAPALARARCPEPAAAARLAAALREQATRPLELARDLLRAAGPANVGRRMLRDVAVGLGPLAALALRGRAPASPLNAPIGPGRRYAMAAIPLAAVKRVRAGAGGTVNDVLLSVVAGALRAALARRGAPAPGRPLRAFVPVNARPADDAGAVANGCRAGNFVSALYCDLPVDEPDPVRRVQRISAEMCRKKSSGEATGVLVVRHAGELSLPGLAALAIRLELAYRRFNLVVSNTFGPQAPRYLLGRRMLSFHPAIPLAPGNSVSIGLLSYAGTIWVGVLGDASAVPDAALIAQDVEDAFEALLREVGAAAPAGAAASRRDAAGAPVPA